MSPRQTKKKTVPRKQTIPGSKEAPSDVSVSTPPDKAVETPTEEQDTFSREQTGFPIVGIGASAGGLAAFEAFFSGMPAVTDPGMAFVLVPRSGFGRD